MTQEFAVINGIEIGKICDTITCDCGGEVEQRGDGHYKGEFGRWYRCTSCGSAIKDHSPGSCPTC